MTYFISGFFAILALAGGTLYYITNSVTQVAAPTPVVQQTPEPKPLPNIIVDTPTAQQVVSGELEVIGKAKGNWFFEASFPIALLDQTGAEVASGIASTASEWMTTDYVPFIGTIDLTGLPAGQYLLRLKKDNPSGEPQNDESTTVPVTVQ
jgi:hypothetical protein